MEVIFDPRVVNEEELVKYFFEIHDFSQENGQGPDIGEQYKSVVFYTNEKQREAAENIVSELRKRFSVATKLLKASEFRLAEDYHQDYYERTGKVPYCHYRIKVFR